MTHVLCGTCEQPFAILTPEFIEYADPESVGIVLDHHLTKHQEAGCNPPSGAADSSSSVSPCSSEPCSPALG